MKQAEARHQDEKRRLEYEMRDQKERAETKLKMEMDKAADKLRQTIDAHTDEMRKFRMDQERKDAEHRDLVDKMRSDFERMLSDQ